MGEWKSAQFRLESLGCEEGEHLAGCWCLVWTANQACRSSNSSLNFIHFWHLQTKEVTRLNAVYNKLLKDAGVERVGESAYVQQQAHLVGLVALHLHAE